MTTPTFRSPYASTTLVALTLGAQAYYDRLKQYVPNLRGVTMTVEDAPDVDLDRIREVNQRIATDPDSVEPAPRPVPPGPATDSPNTVEEPELLNRTLLPYVVITPIGLESILKNVVPENKFQVKYLDVNGVWRYASTRAVEMRIKAKIYTTNYLQAMMFMEYLLATFPNTFQFQYPLFNLPYASEDDSEVESTVQVSTPGISRIKRLKEDGQLYRVEQDLTFRVTMVVLPPGNQNDNGSSIVPDPNDPCQEYNNDLKLIQRINLDIWHGMVQAEDFSNWMGGARITESGTQIMQNPTAKDGHNE